MVQQLLGLRSLAGRGGNDGGTRQLFSSLRGQGGARRCGVVGRRRLLAPRTLGPCALMRSQRWPWADMQEPARTPHLPGAKVGVCITVVPHQRALLGLDERAVCGLGVELQAGAGGREGGREGVQAIGRLSEWQVKVEAGSAGGMHTPAAAQLSRLPSPTDQPKAAGRSREQEQGAKASAPAGWGAQCPSTRSAPPGPAPASPRPRASASTSRAPRRCPGPPACGV